MPNEHLYRGYLIRGVILKGEAKGVVFAGQRRLHVADGADLDTAVASARGWVDSEFAASCQARSAPNIATSEEYVRFFAQHPPAKHEIAMLKAHAEAEGRTMTATELAHAAGWSDYSSANLHYGDLGKRISDTLGLTPRSRSDGSAIGVSALAQNAPEQVAGGHWRWRMHDELLAALQILGIARAMR